MKKFTKPQDFLQYTTKHLVILIVWIILALFFVRISNESWRMQSSILSLQERTKMTELHWDASYKKTSSDIEIFIWPALQTQNQIFVSFFFSPSRIQVLTDKITSPYAYQIENKSDSKLLIKITDFVQWNIDEWIIILPYQWDAKDITVEFVSPSPDPSDSVALWAL